MKEIMDLLIDSQETLNKMEKNDTKAVQRVLNNKMYLAELLMKIKEKKVYEKYVDIHDVILESAQQYLYSGKEVYKLQPLFYYYGQTSYEIDDNLVKVLLKENYIIFDASTKKIEIHDELYIENDHLFEKRNIPFLIKNMISKKDLIALQQLETYIKDLTNYANKVIDGEQ